MSVAGDGNETDESGGSPPAASRRARHRVPPTAAASVQVSPLPEPFIPVRPSIPAIPRQRRPDGPTAVATAAIPVLSGASAGASGASGSVGGYDPPDPPDPPDLPDPPDEPDDGSAPADPATVGTLAGAMRADAASALVEEPAAEGPSIGAHEVADTTGLEFIVTLPGTDSHPAVTNERPPSPPAAATAGAAETAVPEPIRAETVEGELRPGAMLPADDSPTVADYVAPAFAIVTEDVHEDGAEYRGLRRRTAPWRRYPLGALAVAIVLLLITGAVAFQLVSDGGSGDPTDTGLPAKVPGVEVPAVPVPIPDSPSPSGPAGASAPVSGPASSRSRTVSSAAAPSASASAGPSVPATSTSPPPLAQPTSGRLVGRASQKCAEYRAGANNRVVIDNCDSRSGNQRWRIQGDAATGAQLVADNNACLDVQNAGTGNGNPVQVFNCNGTQAQRWIRRGDNTWMNTGSHRCLDAANGGTAASTPLIIWDCSGAANQVWTLQ